MINAISGVTPRFSAKKAKSPQSVSQAEAKRIAEQLFPGSTQGQRIAVVVLTRSPGSASAATQTAKK